MNIYVNGRLEKKCFEAGSEEQMCTVKGLKKEDKLEVEYGDGCSWSQTYTGESSQLNVARERRTGYQYGDLYKRAHGEPIVIIIIIIIIVK